MLYLARIELEMIVEADNETIAERVAVRNCDDELRFQGPDVTLRKIEKLSQVPKEWRSSIPWGGDKSKTCEQILSADTL